MYNDIYISIIIGTINAVFAIATFLLILCNQRFCERYERRRNAAPAGDGRSRDPNRNTEVQPLFDRTPTRADVGVALLSHTPHPESLWSENQRYENQMEEPCGEGGGGRWPTPPSTPPLVYSKPQVPPKPGTSNA